MKKRLDVLLTEQGYFESREKAKAAIMAGLVFIKGQRFDKAGTQVDEDTELEVRGSDCPYVGRGGFKLEKALKVFDLDVTGMVCIDIGASTGGFTDCLLQNGASKVYAVDVGTNQLAWKLRSDSRVVCMEQTNFRYMEEGDIPEKLDFACTDVSFISLKLIFPAAAKLLREGAYMACLVKPQFEAGREQVGKKGIVKDKAVHRQVINKVAGYAQESGFSVEAISYSPITGASGNIEFLMLIKYGGFGCNIDEAAINAVVEEAHGSLKEKEEV